MNTPKTKKQQPGEIRPTRLLRAALWHARRGLPVFPLAPNTKAPAGKDTNWRELATTDPSQIEQWWRDAPYNIGLATGPAGLLVIDLDRLKPTDEIPPAILAAGTTDGRAVLNQLAAEHGPIPRTWTVTTPSGGTHLYFRQPEGLQLGNTAGRLGWKIDTRGHGGYIVAAGSAINGDHYRHNPVRRTADLPAWIADLLSRPAPPPEPVLGSVLQDSSNYGLAALTGELDKLLATKEGSRNDTLNKAAFALGQLIGSGALDANQVHDELLSAAYQIGLSHGEAERTIASGVAAGIKNPRTTTKRTPPSR